MTGKLVRLPLRHVWSHEAAGFTPWLLKNLDDLNRALPFDLLEADCEQPAGTSWVDAVATDADGNIVVIENQLGTSDHDHLGKVITYLATFDAKRAVWIVSEARPEHIQAITWLNESGLAEFYLVKVEAVQIGNSEPAALFTLIVGQGEEIRRAGRKKRELADERSARDLTRFNVTIDGTTARQVPKGRALLKIVQALCGRGHSPESLMQIASMRSYHFRCIDGTPSLNEVIARMCEQEQNEGRRFDTARYFCKQEADLIRFNGTTYVFSNQWGGPEVFDKMRSLCNAFPTDRIDCTPSDEAS
jgi:hypothetical protein